MKWWVFEIGENFAVSVRPARVSADDVEGTKMEGLMFPSQDVALDIAERYLEAEMAKLTAAVAGVRLQRWAIEKQRMGLP